MRRSRKKRGGVSVGGALTNMYFDKQCADCTSAMGHADNFLLFALFCFRFVLFFSPSFRFFSFTPRVLRNKVLMLDSNFEWDACCSRKRAIATVDALTDRRVRLDR